MNIFQISQELQDIFAELEENGGELTEELELKLVVSQADFKAKVKSYGEVIKNTEAEIELIDKEINRLKELKESKNKAIARLEEIIIWAIDMYGETTKTGGKFVDYGTGKISVRNTEKVLVDEDFAKTKVSYFIDAIKELARTKEIFHNELSELIVANDDLKGISADISFNVPLLDLFKDNKFDILRTFFEHNTDFKAKACVNKTLLKADLKDNPDAYPVLAHLVENKTVTIK